MKSKLQADAGGEAWDCEDNTIIPTIQLSIDAPYTQQVKEIRE